MRKGILLALLFLLCSTGSFASTGSDPEARTLGLINGHGWALLGNEGKIAYFVGLMDGWDAREGLAGDTTVAVLLAMWTKDIGNSVDLIDQGYKDPANIDLPVWWTLMAEVSIKRGDMPIG